MKLGELQLKVRERNLTGYTPLIKPYLERYKGNLNHMPQKRRKQLKRKVEAMTSLHFYQELAL